MKTYLPAVGGLTIYTFGDARKLKDEKTEARDVDASVRPLVRPHVPTHERRGRPRPRRTVCGEVTVRVHDECIGSDVFGSDICSCRPCLGCRAVGGEVRIRRGADLVFCGRMWAVISDRAEVTLFDMAMGDPNGWLKHVLDGMWPIGMPSGPIGMPYGANSKERAVWELREVWGTSSWSVAGPLDALDQSCGRVMRKSL